MFRWIWWLAVVVVLLLLNSRAVHAADAAVADVVLGKWWFPEKNGQMEVYRDGEKYFGRVIAYDKPEQLDEKNPDPKLRDRPFVGIIMLHDFVYDTKQEKWTNGTIYDGDTGKTYKCTLWFENNNQDELQARGYIGISLLGRTEVFTRVKPEEAVEE